MILHEIFILHNNGAPSHTWYMCCMGSNSLFVLFGLWQENDIILPALSCKTVEKWRYWANVTCITLCCNQTARNGWNSTTEFTYLPVCSLFVAHVRFTCLIMFLNLTVFCHHRSHAAIPDQFSRTIMMDTKWQQRSAMSYIIRRVAMCFLPVVLQSHQITNQGEGCW